MTREEIVRGLSDILRDVTDLAPARIDEDQSFIADLEIDSLRMVQIVVTAEDRFGVTITDEEAWELRTVADAVTFIQLALAAEVEAHLTGDGAPGSAHR
ncbi:acyl carrier protein [Streptomyces iconiensis]|uniref:Acyl carrier protein n=1 Tax=Streptomyces iconiensis TaxID=1384038 RepID=A0ABT6ZP91_9ACTN|nr:acyl carrier protein [Streptomyces iconiensis]MDJ1130481.1 acyl carrier protein [Streptomyces iconiensis]